MASTKEYRDFILEQLRDLNDITYKPMMGEYLLYYDGLLFGGIYDDRLLVKKVETNKIFQMPEAIPYETAKPMYLVEDVDNIDSLNAIILSTCEGLKKTSK
jgi:TfoX/Sxy family transcriptional regulator of competence genes